MTETTQERSTQAPLFIEQPPQIVYRDVEVGEVVREPWGVKPSRQLVQNIAMTGILQPVLFVKRDDGLHIREGRRRYQAAVDELGWERVAGSIIETDLGVGEHALVLAADLHEPKNVIVHLVALEELMAQTAVRDPVELARRACVPLTLVKRRLKLQPLVGELKEAWLGGEFGSSVGEAAARLTVAQQEKLVKILRANGELKMDDVAEVKKTAVRQHQRTLAGDRTAVRVKEHLSKARNDAYLEWGDGELIELIDKALKALEEVVSE